MKTNARWTAWVIKESATDVPLPWSRNRPPRRIGLRA